MAAGRHTMQHLGTAAATALAAIANKGQTTDMYNTRASYASLANYKPHAVRRGQQ